MGPHNTLFWISLAAGVAVFGLIAVFKIFRGPPGEEHASPEVQDLPDPSGGEG